jgi:5-(carboxyamino)imidazole ribonucleotide synthase
MKRYSVMFNWLGELPAKQKLMSIPGLHWHDYGKTARAGRKLGHATITAANSDQLNQICMQVASDLGAAWPELVKRLR